MSLQVGAVCPKCDGIIGVLFGSIKVNLWSSRPQIVCVIEVFFLQFWVRINGLFLSIFMCIRS